MSDFMGFLGLLLFGLLCLFVGLVLAQFFCPRPKLATGIRLSLSRKGANDMTPGNYVLAAEAIPAGAVLTGLAFVSSDPTVVTVTQRPDDPTKADVVLGTGSAALRADALNAAGEPVFGVLDVSGEVVATGIGLTLTPA